MLSAFSRINLSSGNHLTVNPLRLSEVKVNELSQEDLMRYSREEDADYKDYYCKAVLKLATFVNATFESDYSYVPQYKFIHIINRFRFTLNLKVAHFG